MTAERYGAPPEKIMRARLPWDEYMHYLYLPVWLPENAKARLELPRRLEFLRPLIGHAVAHEHGLRGESDWLWESYIYVTARRGYATPGNPLNRPGWHADGFGTQDVNYIWTDRYPTRFAIQDFTEISDDHVLSAQQFEEQVKESCVVEFDRELLLRLTPEVIHATPIIPSPGGERSFLKISMSKDRYNLKGNSHNHAIDYGWKMWSRSEVRNDPAYAGGDAGPQ